MGVIIDEFEVILDAQQEGKTETSTSEAEGASKGSSLKPLDIAAIFEQQTLRCERVRAH